MRPHTGRAGSDLGVHPEFEEARRDEVHKFPEVELAVCICVELTQMWRVNKQLGQEGNLCMDGACFIDSETSSCTFPMLRETPSDL